MSKNIKWGMEISLSGDDKVQGQFKQLDKTIDDTEKSFNGTSSSAKKAGGEFEQAGKDAKAAGEDAKKGADGFKTAGNETKGSGKKAKKAGDEFEQAGKDTEAAGKGAKKGANGFNKVGVETEKAGKKAKESKSFWKSLKDEFFSLKGMMVSLGFGVVAREMYQGIDSMQGYRAQIKTITGDLDSANTELDRLIKFSRITPYSLDQSVDAFTKLTHLGLNPSEEAMRSYGNTASAMNKDLMQMIEAVADAAVGEFERLKEFGIKASSEGDKVRFTFQNTTTEITKDAESIQQYLLDIGNNKFSTAMEEQMTRLSAKSSNLSTDIVLLWSKFNELGAGSAIGDVINLLSISVVSLTDNLPAIISGLGSLAKIIGVSGVLYLGYLGLSAAIAAVNAGTIGLTLASLRLRVSLLLVSSGLFTAVTAANALKASFFALAALYAGWELGSWLSENFLEARLAGLAFVRAMEIGFTYLSFAFDASMESIKFGWESSLNGMREMAGSFYSAIASGLSAVGADETAAIYTRAAASYTANITKVEDLTGKLTDLNKQRDADIAKIDETINWLVNHEIAVANGTKTLKANTDAVKDNLNGVAKELTANQKLVVSIQKEIAALSLSSKEKLVQTNLSKLSAKATQTQKDEIRELTEALFDQTEAYKSLDLSDLTSQTNDYGEAWTNVGNVIIDTFGSMADKLTNLGEIQDGYIKQMDDIATRRETISSIPDLEKRAQGLKELKALKNNVIKENTQAQLSAYGSIAGAAASMFHKKTTAAKALAAVEKGIAVTQIALTIKKMYADDISTVKEVTNSGIRATAKGTEAVATAATAPWPIGLGLAVAMLAFLGSVGLSLGGGSGGGGNGTGAASTVKGGGLSESLSKANEGLEGIMIDQLAELRGLRGDITNVQNLSYGLLSSLLNVDVGHHEIKNATERDLERSIRGLNAGVAGGTFTNELKGIFEGIDEAIGESIDILGVETTKSLSDFVYKVGTISFDGLDGEEAGKRLDSILSAQSDLRVESIAPFTAKYQQLGEGALQTLVRLAKEQTVFNDTLDRFGMSISNLSEIMQIDVAQSLIELTGGFDKFSELSDSFFENFFTDAERFDFLEKSLTETFDSLGLSIVSSKEEFRTLIEGLDLTTDAGQELFAALLEINPAMAEYTDELEKTIEKEKELSVARQAFTDDLQSQLERLDMSPLELALDSLNQRYIDDLAKAEELNVDISLLETFYGKQRVAVIDKHLADGEKAFETSIKKITSELTKLLDAIGDTKNGIAANIRNIQRAMGGFDEIDFANGNVNSLTNQLGQGSLAEQVNTIEQLNDAINERYQLELDNIQGLADAAQNRYDSELDYYQNIKGALKDVASFTKTFALSGASPLSAGQRLGKASNNFYQDFSKAINDKDLDAISNITNSASAYRDEARSYWGSSSQFALIFNSIESGLNQVANLGIKAPEIPNVVNEYQTDAIALQTSTIAELQGLQGMLDTLAVDAQVQAGEATEALTEQWHEQQALMLEANELQKSALAEQQKTNQKLDQANQQSGQVIDLLQKINSQNKKNVKAVEELNNQLMARSGTNNA